MSVREGFRHQAFRSTRTRNAGSCVMPGRTDGSQRQLQTSGRGAKRRQTIDEVARNKGEKHRVFAARSKVWERIQPREFPMKSILIAALSAATICGFAVLTPAAAQATAPGAPRGTAPVTIEGYGPSSAIVCDQAGTTCWHSVDRYMTIRQMRTWWFIRTTGKRTTAPTTPGESTPAAAIGRVNSGSSSDPQRREL